jgi:uncharacterized protein YndB with AHSA1/START domain
MTSVEHGTFVLERSYPAPPGRVFAAWADPEAKAQWFGGVDFSLDFRVGGRETNGGGPDGGPFYRYDATYRDIVPDERIVYTYEMLMDGTRISVSLATVELKPDGQRTLLILTEHGAFFDGLDSPAVREQGTGSLLEALGRELQRNGEDGHET